MGMSSLSLSLSADFSCLIFCSFHFWPTTSEDVQYKCGCAIKIISTSNVDHQVLIQGNTTQKYFPMNESLFLLIYQVKLVSSK